jgi:hypothetical protein
MRALADLPVAGEQLFKCPHCRRIQRAAASAAGEGHLSSSLVEPGQP